MRRRILVGLVASLCVVVMASRGEGPPESNGSTDGRVHTCGYRTSDGVTEHLAAYQARCGTYADPGGLYCWYEINAEMPDGREKICGTLTQEQQAKEN